MDATLVLVHGAGGGAWEWIVWEETIRALQPSWECISVHLSPLEGKDYETTSLEDYVEQVISSGQTVNRDKRLLVLIGASMGGTLTAKAAETLQPDALVFVCTTIPLLIGRSSSTRPPPAPLSPARIEWQGGHLQATVDALPDATLDMCEFACARWRDESGAVVNSINAGVEVNLISPTAGGGVPMCFVVPGDDDSIPPTRQVAFAHEIGAACVLEYEGMSHVGPLLGTRASEVCRDVVAFLLRDVAELGAAEQ